jgi:hypothetical protein
VSFYGNFKNKQKYLKALIKNINKKMSVKVKDNGEYKSIRPYDDIGGDSICDPVINSIVGFVLQIPVLWILVRLVRILIPGFTIMTSPRSEYSLAIIPVIIFIWSAWKYMSSPHRYRPDKDYEARIYPKEIRLLHHGKTVHKFNKDDAFATIDTDDEIYINNIPLGKFYNPKETVKEFGVELLSDKTE